MTLKKQEKELLEEIENKGLERKVRHFRFDEPRDIKHGSKKYEDTVAVTRVHIGNFNVGTL